VHALCKSSTYSLPPPPHPPNTPSPFHRRSADHYHPHSGNLVNFLKRSAFAYGLYTLLSAFKVIVVWNMKLPRTPLYQEIFSIILTKCFHKKTFQCFFRSFFPDGENFPCLKEPTGQIRSARELYQWRGHPSRFWAFNFYLEWLKGVQSFKVLTAKIYLTTKGWGDRQVLFNVSRTLFRIV
jgi:hypothetical protein